MCAHQVCIKYVIEGHHELDAACVQYWVIKNVNDMTSPCPCSLALKLYDFVSIVFSRIKINKDIRHYLRLNHHISAENK